MSSKSRVPGVSEARAQIVEQCLSRRPWLSVSDLALVLGTSHPAALIVLNRLHAAGYLIRRIGISNSSLFRCQLYALRGGRRKGIFRVARRAGTARIHRRVGARKIRAAPAQRPWRDFSLRAGDELVRGDPSRGQRTGS